jgi:hypothetical protein
MAKMAINSGAVLEIWNLRTKTRDIEDVDHCINIKGVPELLVYFLGIEDHPGFKQTIGEGTVTVNKQKHLFDGGSDGDYTDSPSYRHTTLSETLQTQPSHQSSMPTCPSTPSITSLLFSVPSSPLFSDMELLDFLSTPSGHDESYLGGMEINYDTLWVDGYVHVPEGKSWPDGMYARDMAWAFTKLRQDQKDIEA